MFQAEIVRAEVEHQGVRLRVWIYGDNDEFRAAGEVTVPYAHLAQWALEVSNYRVDAMQQALFNP